MAQLGIVAIDLFNTIFETGFFDLGHLLGFWDFGLFEDLRRGRGWPSGFVHSAQWQWQVFWWQKHSPRRNYPVGTEPAGDCLRYSFRPGRDLAAHRGQHHMVEWDRGHRQHPDHFWRTQVEPPTISVARNDDNSVTVTFDGTLQAAPTVNGPWQDIQGESPIKLTPDQAQQFGRAVKN